jgi:hypothetical protein
MMTSRERMLAALHCQQPDRTPCAFMLYNALKERCRDVYDFVDRQLEMGLDAYVQVPLRQPHVVDDHYNLHGLPVSYHPQVSVAEWIENPPDEEYPLMLKEYRTPAGVLRAEVRQSPGWRWGDHVPFLDDYIAPRARRFPVTGPQDLQPLSFLLQPPTAREATAFRTETQQALDFARKRSLLVAGGWGVGADMFGWIYGLENAIFAAADQPGFLADLLDLVAQWNRRRMQLVLEAGIDLYIKRAWYENCDFWSPRTWRKFIFPILKADADLVHAKGAAFGYLITSNVMPLLEMIAEAGVDVLIGADPHTWDLPAARQKLAGRVCLWGGVNGHLTVEGGSPDAVRAEVRTAMQVLAPGGGFILSPVDNIRQDTPAANANVQVLLEEYQKL